MTLSGAIAQRRPDIDELGPGVALIVVHERREVDKSGLFRRHTSAPRLFAGRIDRDTGMYRATANRLTEVERREAGIRRNGRSRRRSG